MVSGFQFFRPGCVFKKQFKVCFSDFAYIDFWRVVGFFWISLDRIEIIILSCGLCFNYFIRNLFAVCDFFVNWIIFELFCKNAGMRVFGILWWIFPYNFWNSCRIFMILGFFNTWKVIYQVKVLNIKNFAVLWNWHFFKVFTIFVHVNINALLEIKSYLKND